MPKLHPADQGCQSCIQLIKDATAASNWSRMPKLHPTDQGCQSCIQLIKDAKAASSWSRMPKLHPTDQGCQSCIQLITLRLPFSKESFFFKFKVRPRFLDFNYNNKQREAANIHEPITFCWWPQLRNEGIVESLRSVSALEWETILCYPELHINTSQFSSFISNARLQSHKW